MAVVDVISFNGEFDILEIRLNVLDPYVDEFIIVEAPSNFGGLPKPIYYLEQKERFKKWEHKIKHFVIDENYTSEEIEFARDSKYTNGDIRWMHEFLQKESIKKALTHLQDDDLCYIGDVDEIWEHKPYNGIEKLKLRVYTYYLNFLSTEEFWGPMRCLYKDVKNECLNNIRNDISFRTADYEGCHFTNQGGLEAVRKKVADQYTGIIFNQELIERGVDVRFGVKDYIGRDFTFTVDESGWPEWLKEHRQDYQHLLK